MARVDVVAACLVRGGKVLAAQRKTGPSAGRWEFPGGKVIAGENPRVALQREIREELAAGIEVGALIGTATDHGTTIAFYRCRLRGGYTLKEHHAALWLGPEELDSVPWLPADRAVLDAVRTHLA
ncbi:MAG: (deoxy)nucleoside triphosphate pyrophosphohydrolase [Bifidobacteriaceae bacterium]|jgi:8-oxo-dGTP diphosphatase|nr:(deoxy)nucleoside triphosphate pyrophosphohydrolase [Bifidobacteriaceae bacterium]